MASNATVNATIAAFAATVSVHTAAFRPISAACSYALSITGFSAVPPGIGQVVLGRDSTS